MLTTRHGAWLSIAVLVFLALGCASAGTPRTIAPGDLASLSGVWNGTVIPPSGGGGAMNQEGTMTLAANGDYTVRVGAFVTQGKAQVKDGALEMASTSTTGGLTTSQRTSRATLSERPDGMLVLTGMGHSDAGPFNFEFTRRK